MTDEIGKIDADVLAELEKLGGRKRWVWKIRIYKALLMKYSGLRIGSALSGLFLQNKIIGKRLWGNTFTHYRLAGNKD